MAPVIQSSIMTARPRPAAVSRAMTAAEISNDIVLAEFSMAKLNITFQLVQPAVSNLSNASALSFTSQDGVRRRSDISDEGAHFWMPWFDIGFYAKLFQHFRADRAHGADHHPLERKTQSFNVLFLARDAQ